MVMTIYHSNSSSNKGRGAVSGNTYGADVVSLSLARDGGGFWKARRRRQFHLPRLLSIYMGRWRAAASRAPLHAGQPTLYPSRWGRQPWQWLMVPLYL